MTRTFFGFPRVTRIAVAAVMMTISAGLVQAQKNGVPSKPDARTVAHVLDRIGFGARPGDVARVQQIGLAAYIEQQLHPERIADGALTARLSEFTTISMSTADLAKEIYVPADQAKRQAKQAQAAMDPAMAGNPPARPGQPPLPGQPPRPNQPPPNGANPPQPSPEQRMLQQRQQSVIQELMQAKVLRESMSERQLEEVLVDFWFNHFNVFVGKGQVRQYLTEYERDAIRPYVLGNFRDLLGSTAHSPAMLFYLDNYQSRTPNPTQNAAGRGGRGNFPGLQQRLADPRLTAEQRQQIMTRLNVAAPPQQRPQGGLNENYARELMELHTLGVDGGYTQADVIEVAKILTGWTIDRPQQGGDFVFRSEMHDTGKKTVMGKVFNSDGEQEGERLLDMLAMHPNTAHHIAYKLAQRFIADEPPAAVVDRAAKKFLDSKGDLREVTRVIITSPEFFEQKYYSAKVKTPLEFVVSAVRATNANVVNAQPMVQALNQLGMPLYGAQPPTGYSMTADAWVNTGALLNRMNFAQQLVNNGVPLGGAPPAGRGGPGRAGQPGQQGQPGQPPPMGQNGQPVRPIPVQGQPGQGRGALQQEQQMIRQAQLTGRGPLQVDLRALAADTTDASVTHAIQTLISGGVSEATRSIIAKAATPQQLVALTLGSPEFQKR